MTIDLLIETTDQLKRITKRINKKHKGLIIAGAVIGSFARGKYYGKEETDLDIIIITRKISAAEEQLEQPLKKLLENFSRVDIFLQKTWALERTRAKIPRISKESSILDVGSSGPINDPGAQIRFIDGRKWYWRILFECIPFFNKEMFDSDRRLLESNKFIVKLEEQVFAIKEDFSKKYEKMMERISELEKSGKCSKHSCGVVRRRLQLVKMGQHGWLICSSIDEMKKWEQYTLYEMRKELDRLEEEYKTGKTPMYFSLIKEGKRVFD